MMRREPIHTSARLLLGTALLLLLYGCEFSRTVNPSSPPIPVDTSSQGGSGIALALDPLATSVPTGGSEQFQATVTGTADTEVLWTVSSGPGTISADGLYTAPATITGDSATAVVRAASVADSTVSATATITIIRAVTGGGDTTVAGSICFEQDVLPIFASSCAMSGCHDVGTHKEGLILNSYAGIISQISPGNPARSKIYQMITNAKGGKGENDIMPPRSKNSPLTADQIATIKKWIEEGAKNTSCSSAGGGDCDTVNVTFAATIKPIFQNNCVGCHSGPAAPNGVNLTAYAGAKKVADNGKLAGVIQHLPGFSAMPKGGAKLPPCKVAQILAWIDRGAPNN